MFAIQRVCPRYWKEEDRTRPPWRTSNVGVPKDGLNRMAVNLFHEAGPSHSLVHWRIWSSESAWTSCKQQTSTCHHRSSKKSCHRLSGSAIPCTFNVKTRSEYIITDRKPDRSKRKELKKCPRDLGDRAVGKCWLRASYRCVVSS